MEYVYIAKVRFTAFDDVEARQRLKEMGIRLPDVDGVVKEESLQETFKNKAPRKVVLK